MHLLAERFVFWGWGSGLYERGSQDLFNDTKVCLNFLLVFTSVVYGFTYVTLQPYIPTSLNHILQSNAAILEPSTTTQTAFTRAIASKSAPAQQRERWLVWRSTPAPRGSSGGALTPRILFATRTATHPLLTSVALLFSAPVRRAKVRSRLLDPPFRPRLKRLLLLLPRVGLISVFFITQDLVWPESFHHLLMIHCIHSFGFTLIHEL